MRRIQAIATALFAFLSLTSPTFAEKRVALVVGNSSYVHIPRLANPANDARLMADTLKALGFTLVGNGPQLDLDEAGLRRVVQAFGAQLQGADVGLFYFAGHGVQVRGSNYLVPVGANPTKEADVDFQMLDANTVLRQMEAAGTRLSLVLLDACRNNPLGGQGLRTTASGLAQMQAPKGTLISFATQPGNVALDGNDGNSPYTKALAQTIRRAGLDIFQAFNEVGLAVDRATGGAQQPWLSSSPISGSFFFAGTSATSQPAPSTQVAVVAPPVRPTTSSPPAAVGKYNRIHLSGVIGSKRITAELVRSGDRNWVWTENNVKFYFRSTSETATEMIIYDSSRDMYHRFDLIGREEVWRIGTMGNWNRHYSITKVE